LVLENGKVVQQGRHAEMAALTDSPYQKLLAEVA